MNILHDLWCPIVHKSRPKRAKIKTSEGLTPTLLSKPFSKQSSYGRNRSECSRKCHVKNPDWEAFSYPEPILRAVNGARQGALAKSISNWHLIGHNEGCCSNTGYILLPCFYGIRLWIWPEPLVAPRIRRALGTRMDWEAASFTVRSLSPPQRFQ